VGQELESEKPN